MTHSPAPDHARIAEIRARAEAAACSCPSCESGNRDRTFLLALLAERDSARDAVVPSEDEIARIIYDNFHASPLSLAADCKHAARAIVDLITRALRSPRASKGET